MKLAKRICANAPIALYMIKEAVNYGVQMELNSAIRVEARLSNILFDTECKVEGMRAFVEKRKPNFYEVVLFDKLVKSSAMPLCGIIMESNLRF
jgi:enoyl-CoA hydratase